MTMINTITLDIDTKENFLKDGVSEKDLQELFPVSTSVSETMTVKEMLKYTEGIPETPLEKKLFKKLLDMGAFN